jgi:hypothetical protein
MFLKDVQIGQRFSLSPRGSVYVATHVVTESHRTGVEYVTASVPSVASYLVRAPLTTVYTR